MKKLLDNMLNYLVQQFILTFCNTLYTLQLVVFKKRIHDRSNSFIQDMNSHVKPDHRLYYVLK